MRTDGCVSRLLHQWLGVRNHVRVCISVRVSSRLCVCLCVPVCACVPVRACACVQPRRRVIKWACPMLHGWYHVQRFGLWLL